MGDRTQRVKGKAEEVTGRLKATVAHDVRDGSTEAKGAARVAKGRARWLAGRASSAFKKRTR
jgi:uncharacterized protein YjbJ (UPF0337 family)